MVATDPPAAGCRSGAFADAGYSVNTTYTGRRVLCRGGSEHFAEVAVQAEPIGDPSKVVLSPAVLAYLRDVSGPDFEHARHCVWAAVAAQIDTANVAGEMPRVGATSFRAEVIGVRVSGNAGREVSGALLSMAGMRAIGGYLEDWENEEDGCG
jgi:hypothetical protein